jgi:CheY-like chemotaxis protein
LVAEDYETNQLVTMEYLKSVGCEVAIAENGVQALEYSKKEAFDLVLMDVQMPEMDGLEATRQIRDHQEHQGRRTPIIALTASVYASDRQACKAAGMDGFLQKPLKREDLYTMLDLWLERAEPATAAEKTAGELAGKKEGGQQQLPEVLPGIDIKRALSVLGFNPPVYRQILENFHGQNLETQERIWSAFAGQDWRSLEQLAHSLKSTSANIGAMELHEAALVLEKRCKEATISLADETLIDKVAILLAQVLDSLQSLPADPPKQKVSPALPLPDAARIIPMLERLAETIHLADTESIGAELDRLREHLSPSLLEGLESHICNYDYDEALEALGDIERHLTDNH